MVIFPHKWGESDEAQMGLSDFFKFSPTCGENEIGTNFVQTYRFFRQQVGESLLKEKENGINDINDS